MDVSVIDFCEDGFLPITNKEILRARALILLEGISPEHTWEAIVAGCALSLSLGAEPRRISQNQ